MLRGSHKDIRIQMPNQACDLRKHRTCDCHMPKQHLIDMACDSKWHATKLRHVVSVKLNIGKKIKGLETMTLNGEKRSMFSNL